MAGAGGAVGSAGERTREGLDVVGLVLIGLTVLATMWPFVTAESYGGLSEAPWWLLGMGVMGWALFMTWELYWQRAGHAVVLPLGLMRNTSYVLGTALGAAYFAAFTGIFMILTLFLQQGLGMSAFWAGIAQVPFALGSALAASVSGRVVNRFGRWAVLGGLTLVLVGTILTDLTVVLAPADLLPYLLPLTLVINGLGSGSTISPNQTLTLHDIPLRQAGTAGGLLQTTQRIGASVGLAITSTIFFASLALAGVVQGGQAANPGLDRTALLDDYRVAMSLSLRLTIAMTVVALVIGLADALRRRPEK